MDKDLYFIKCAYRQASKALSIDEVPVGAVIVKDNKIIAKAYNQKEKLNDPTAHAEILAIKKACKKSISSRLFRRTSAYNSDTFGRNL